MFGTVEEDVSLAGFDKHKTAEAAPAPLTDAEVALRKKKKKRGKAANRKFITPPLFFISFH